MKLARLLPAVAVLMTATSINPAFANDTKFQLPDPSYVAQGFPVPDPPHVAPGFPIPDPPHVAPGFPIPDPPHVAPGFPIPASATKDSSYQLTCSNISVRGAILSANCRKKNGNYRHTSIPIQGIENINGGLEFHGSGNSSTYQKSCNQISVAGATLSANCRRIDGSYNKTSILIPGIQNIDGKLMY